VLLAHSSVGWWLAPVVARTLLPLAFVTLPYVRGGGMGHGLAENASRRGLIIAVLVVAAVLALSLSAALWMLWLVAAIGLFALWRRSVQRRLGGFTGDCAGALVELLEAALLATAALLVAGAVP